MRKSIYLPLLAGLAFAAAGCDESVLTAVGPSEALAQEAADGAQRRGPGMPGRGMNPLGRLLEHREELALTAEQVTRLEALAAELRTRNEALRAEMQANRPQRPELTAEQREAMRQRRQGGAAGAERPQLTEAQREAMRARREAMRPQMEQLAASQRQAMEQVRSILSDEQEAKLKELRPEGRAGRRRGGAPGQGFGPGR